MAKSTTRQVSLPDGVEAVVTPTLLTLKNAKLELSQNIHSSVSVEYQDNQLVFTPKNNSKFSKSLVGTYKSLTQNMITGITTGFEKKLKLVGVGYRAKINGKTLNLNLGFSHPVDYVAPDSITIETPSQTEIVVKGPNKQIVGQVAADIRKYRPPEPYKGKGIRYVDEYVKIKEAKKK